MIIYQADQLKAGQSGVIKDYAGEGELQDRLKELGLTRGTLIKVERFAPFGDPIEFEVRGYHLAIRKEDASQILVTLV